MVPIGADNRLRASAVLSTMLLEALYRRTWAAVKVMPTLISPWYVLSARTTLCFAALRWYEPCSAPRLMMSVTSILQRGGSSISWVDD